ncbi:MAG: exodeoxyribonuclease III [Dongiaceae bacterium]
MQIATFNVNSIKARWDIFQAWLKEAKPDVALLQELKCVNENFPTEEVKKLGYHSAVAGQKTYNGVAVLSKTPITVELTALPGDPADDHARYIEVTLPGRVRVASVYVPNGQSVGSDAYAYKLKFYRRLYEHVKYLLQKEEVFVLGGDFNVAPEEIDVHNPGAWQGEVLFSQPERAALRSLFHLGMLDAWRAANPKAEEYSWWDYRQGAFERNDGLRIDHLLLSPQAADLLEASAIDLKPRKMEKPSDHAPVTARLSFPAHSN